MLNECVKVLLDDACEKNKGIRVESPCFTTYHDGSSQRDSYLAPYYPKDDNEGFGMYVIRRIDASEPTDSKTNHNILGTLKTPRDIIDITIEQSHRVTLITLPDICIIIRNKEYKKEYTEFLKTLK